MKTSSIILTSIKSFFIVFLSGGCSQVTRTTQRLVFTSPTLYRNQPLNLTAVWYKDPVTIQNPVAGELTDWQSIQFKSALLNNLDDETVCISLETNYDSGESRTGISGISMAGEHYVLILDCIKYNEGCRYINIEYQVAENGTSVGTCFKGCVLVYTGFGFLIRAEFTAHKSALNISGLPALSIVASNESIRGCLTVSTLAITDRDVSPLMSIFSDISITSIQNAMLAIGSIRSKIYEENTVVNLTGAG